MNLQSYLFTFRSGPDFSAKKSHKATFTREQADTFADGLRLGGARSVEHSVIKPKRRASINAVIRYLGVKVLAARRGNTYLGYSYFVDLKSGQQVGDSVMVYRQNQLSPAQWLAEAMAAVEKSK